MSVDLDEEPVAPSTSTGGFTDYGDVEAVTTVILTQDVVHTIAEMASPSTVKHTGKGKSSVGRPPKKKCCKAKC